MASIIKGIGGINMAIKLLALDMDGTVLQNDAISVSQRNLRAIKTAIQSGVAVTYCTGRMRHRLPTALLEGAPEIQYAVTSNGASVLEMHTGKLLYSDGFPQKLAGDLATALSGYPIPVDVYCNGYNYCEQRAADCIQALPISPSRIQEAMRGRIVVPDLPQFLYTTSLLIEKINLYSVPEACRKQVWQLLECTEGIRVTSSFAGNMEINVSTATKAHGLAHLGAYLGISAEETMAIGDNQNDLEMLHYAGLPVAMGNSTPEVLEQIPTVTGTNQEDGVAQAIERFILH